ncbi:MAG TPA: efflux RND transporter periplasmic adaptor subunit [Bacteroidota bacterium]|nr:efflux RND transporter periplasmic adaptor subunit [Bacteroidota bacterium]
MKKRMIIMLAVMAVVVGAVGFIKYNQITAAIAQHRAFMPPPEAVTTSVAADEQWQVTLDAIGSVTAAQGVVVSADLPGIVASIDFESGARVKAGDVLVRLDTRQEAAQLAAAEAAEHLARVNLDRLATLRAQGVAAQAEYDQADAEAKQAAARMRETRAVIERKTIRAPFAGILGIRVVNLGEYVNAGQSIVPLQALDRVFVDFAVPQQQMHDVHVGAELDVAVDGRPGIAARGRVSAINSVIDQSTRNVTVRATFANPAHTLLPGMFVKASVVVGEAKTVLGLPASAISHAPYGDFVFVVDSLIGPTGAKYRGVRQQVVHLGEARGDQVAILEGVKAGDEVATSGVFKLRSGAAVLVSNAVQPEDKLNPQPEDN